MVTLNFMGKKYFKSAISIKKWTIETTKAKTSQKQKRSNSADSIDTKSAMRKPKQKRSN